MNPPISINAIDVCLVMGMSINAIGLASVKSKDIEVRISDGLISIYRDGRLLGKQGQKGVSPTSFDWEHAASMVALP